MATMFALQAEKQMQGSTAAIKLWSGIPCLNTADDQGYSPSFRNALGCSLRGHIRRHTITFSEANKEILGVLTL